MIHHFINITAAVETCLNGTSPGLPLQNDSRDALTGTSHITPDNDCTDALIGASHKTTPHYCRYFQPGCIALQHHHLYINLGGCSAFSFVSP